MKYVFYINVGELASHKAMSYIDSVKESCRQNSFFEIDDKVLYIAIRDGESRLDVLTENEFKKVNELKSTNISTICVN